MPAPPSHEVRGGCLCKNCLQSGRSAMPTPDTAGDLRQHCIPMGSCVLPRPSEGEGGCTGLKGISPSQTHIHLEPQKVTLFGNRIFVDAIT